MKTLFESAIASDTIPTIMVVGCGRVGENFVHAFVDNVPHDRAKIYVTDSDKGRARKLSEYRLSSITPIRWRAGHDTPEDVDIIVVAVDRDSEHKIIDRLALSGKPFVSLSDDASVHETYEEYRSDFLEHNICGVLGSGLVPGASDVLVDFCAQRFDSVLELSVDRIGFVSSASLASIKAARRESPLSVRDGMFTDSRRIGGTSLVWFPAPYNLIECQAVAVGVSGLKQNFPDTHNIAVRYGEPRLPTFNERVRNIFFNVPLPVSRACIRAEVHGIRSGEIVSDVLSLTGDALTIITATTLACVLNLYAMQPPEHAPFLSASEVVDSPSLLKVYLANGVTISRFEGGE